MSDKMNDAVQQQIDIISNRLRTKLELSDIKKKDIAYQTDLSINTINNCLKGKNVNISSILKIAYSLGMNFVDLANLTSSEKTNAVPAVETKVRSVSIDKVAEVKEETGAPVEQLSWRMGMEKEEATPLQKALESTSETVSSASPEMQEEEDDVFDMFSM